MGKIAIDIFKRGYRKQEALHVGGQGGPENGIKPKRQACADRGAGLDVW
ncbi:MAG: hypothetical protein JJU19_17110 [Pararhodobacter sp.]|nr:hypothetical protein [Pararhodobacter sp.]